MNEECTIAETDTVAARIRREFAAVGFSVEGLADDLTTDQGLEFLRNFLVKIEGVSA